MKILIIDTTKLTAFIVAKIDEQTFVKIIPETQKHSEELLNGIEYVLTCANEQLSNFDAVCAITGPGSFTGIRIGMSTVKAFVCAHNIKLMQATFFDVLSPYVKNGTIILKNTNTTCYLAIVKNSQIVKQEIVEFDKIEQFAEGEIFALEQEHLGQILSYINISTINNYPNLLEAYFTKKYNEKQFVDICNFVPFYMQLSQAERELKGKNDDKSTN